jgi:hypothetical protein
MTTWARSMPLRVVAFSVKSRLFAAMLPVFCRMRFA